MASSNLFTFSRPTLTKMFRKAVYFAGSRRGKHRGPYHLSSLVILAFLVLALLLDVPSFLTNASEVEQLSLANPLVVKWSFETEDIINLTPAVNKERIYLPLAAGTLLSLRLDDGTLVWRAEVGGQITASPLADERTIYIASGPKSVQTTPPASVAKPALRALGPGSGITLWMKTLPSSLTGVIAASETTLFGCAEDGRMYAIRKSDGTLLWVSRNERPFTPSPVIKGERLYVGSVDGSVYALDQGSGRVIWRYRTGAAVSTHPVVSGQAVYVGSADNNIYAISLLNGRPLWRYRTGGSIQSVVVTARGVLATSLDNFAFLLSAKRGQRVWKRQMAGRVAAAPATTSDGALFAPLSGDECVILDLQSGRRLNAIYVGEDNNTAADPLIVGRTLLLTTRKGLMAFTDSK